MGKGRISSGDIVTNKADIIRELSEEEKMANTIIVSLPMTLHMKIYKVRFLNIFYECLNKNIRKKPNDSVVKYGFDHVRKYHDTILHGTNRDGY